MFSNLTIKIMFWCVVILAAFGVIPWVVLGSIAALLVILVVCVFIYVMATDKD